MWSSFSRNTKAKDFSPPRYFAPVPSLMRARHTLITSLFTRISTRANSKEPTIGSRRHEIWLVLNSLPPRFLKFLHGKKSWDMGKIIDLMTTRLLKRRKGPFLRDWERASQRNIDNSLQSRTLQPISKNRDERRPWLWRTIHKRSSYPDLQDALDGYPDLMDVLSEAWSSSTLLAFLVRTLVLHLLNHGRRIRPCNNRDILSVEDIISLLPGRTMTSTALYRVTEAMTLRHTYAVIIPPSLLKAWTENRKNILLLEGLDTYFQVGIENALKTVYILPPPFEGLESLAICSVTSSYCSTLLMGIEETLGETERFLSSLFRNIPS